MKYQRFKSKVVSSKTIPHVLKCIANEQFANRTIRVTTYTSFLLNNVQYPHIMRITDIFYPIWFSIFRQRWRNDSVRKRIFKAVYKDSENPFFP